MTIIKTCNRCKQKKKITNEEEYFDKVCKDCDKKYKELDKQIKEKKINRTYNILAKNKKYIKFKIKYPEYYKNYYRMHPEKFKASIFKKKYNLSIEQYNIMLDYQNYRCDICGILFDKYKRPEIDHNHITGKVRAILCSSCNKLISNCNEKIDILNSAQSYLIRHRI